MARKLTKRQRSTARTSTKIYYAASFDEIAGTTDGEPEPRTGRPDPQQKPPKFELALAHGRSQP